MAEININSRIVHKHDIESNWLNAVSFIPLKGELIVYDIDENYAHERFKIGDGITNISELPFVNDDIKNLIDTLVGDVPVSEQISTSIQDVLYKTQQELTNEELDQVRKNLRFIGKDVEGQQFTIDGVTVTASPNAEIFGDYDTNIAVGQWSIAEGSGTVAKGRVAHAEGAFTQALNDGCHTEGYQTVATGFWSHAEGEMTRVTSYASHAEGSYTKMPDGTTRYSTAAGYASHTEGGGCHTNGVASHAEGIGTTANGRCAHVEGTYTVASGKAQHVEGVANIEDTNDQYIHIAGNGTDPSDRSNAHHLDWNGNAWFAGDVYVGSTSGIDKDEGSKKLATEEYVNSTCTSMSIEEIDTICGATI